MKSVPQLHTHMSPAHRCLWSANTDLKPKMFKTKGMAHSPRPHTQHFLDNGCSIFLGHLVKVLELFFLPTSCHLSNTTQSMSGLPPKYVQNLTTCYYFMKALWSEPPLSPIWIVRNILLIILLVSPPFIHHLKHVGGDQVAFLFKILLWGCISLQ